MSSGLVRQNRIVVTVASAVVVSVSFCLLSWTSSSALLLAPGDLDPSFGTGGKVITDINLRRNSAKDGVLQSDGKLVVVGTISSGGGSSDDFLVVRYNTDGSIDNAFGTSGSVIIDHNNRSDDARAVALQTDGKLVIFGQTVTTQFPLSYELLAVRINADGTLDTSFGIGGRATTAWGNFPQFGNAVLIQPDGRIVGAGQARDAANLPAMGVVRFNADGTLDGTFGTGGKVIVSFGGEDVGSASSVNLQPDGKLVIAGIADRPVTFRDFAVARLHADGSLDPTFGTGGKVMTDVDRSDGVGDSAIQPDGKIILFGFSFTGSKLALVRYNPDGSLDGLFGNGGKVETNPVGGENFGAAVALQPDGKILATGSCGFFPDRNFAVLRYNANGTLDSSFGTNGFVITPIGSATLDNPSDILLQKDGKIVVPGEVFTDGPTGLDIAIVRYLNDLIITPTPSPTPTPTATPTSTPSPTPTPAGFEGDVTPRANGDGIVLATDVTQMRRFVVGLDTPATSPNEFQRADMAPLATRGDGVVNSADVVQARRFVTGLDPLTPAGGPTVPIATRPGHSSQSP